MSDVVIPQRFYFAHNFNDRKLYRKLELQLEKELGLDLFNPFYDDPTRVEEMEGLDTREAGDVERMLDLEKRKPAVYPDSFENRFKRNCDESDLIVRRDLTNLAKSDALFTIVRKPSFGTAIEICNAKLMCKPIYFVSQQYSKHPWIQVYADHIFACVDEFRSFVKRAKNE